MTSLISNVQFIDLPLVETVEEGMPFNSGRLARIPKHTSFVVSGCMLSEIVIKCVTEGELKGKEFIVNPGVIDYVFSRV